MLSGRLEVSSLRKMELIDITSLIAKLLPASAGSSVLYLFNPHTTAGLTINEGADPDVRLDIIAGLSAIVPGNLPFRHAEGNSPAHIMASLIGTSLTLLVEDHHLVLGRWQKIFFCEFDGPRTRQILWRLTSSV